MMIYLIAANAVVIPVVFFLGYAKGKQAERNSNIRKSVDNVVEVKKRVRKRANDSIDDVRSSLSKFSRD